MIEITYQVINDINNVIDVNEFLNEDVKIFIDSNNVYHIFKDIELIFISDNITSILEYVLQHLIETGGDE